MKVTGQVHRVGVQGQNLCWWLGPPKPQPGEEWISLFFWYSISVYPSMWFTTQPIKKVSPLSPPLRCFKVLRLPRHIRNFCLLQKNSHSNHPTYPKQRKSPKSSKSKIFKVFHWQTVPLLLTAAAYLQQLYPAPQPQKSAANHTFCGKKLIKRCCGIQTHQKYRLNRLQKIHTSSANLCTSQHLEVSRLSLRNP